MKRFKKIAAFIGAGIMALMLSSCMAFEQGLEFDKKGTVTVYTDFTIEKEMFSTAELTEDNFFDKIEESDNASQYKDWNKEKVEKQVGGKGHVGTRFYKNISYDELNSMEQFQEGAVNAVYNITETKDTIDVTVTFTHLGEESDSELVTYIVGGMVTTSYSVKTPYEIISTNGEKSADGTTITWDIIDVMVGTVSEKVLTVSMEKEAEGFSAGVIIALCAAFVIPIAALVIILIATRKPSAAEKEEIAPIQTYSQTESVDESTEEPSAQEENSVIADETTETTAQPSVPEEESNERRYCRNCGNLTEKEDKFCTNCGEKLNR